MGSGKGEALIFIFFRKLQGGKWEGGSANYYFQRERRGGEEEVSRWTAVNC